MTQVPEYLLQRSRERRAALGLPPSAGGEGAAPAPAEGEATAAAEAPAAGGVPAPAEAPVPAAAAAAPAEVEPAAPPIVPPAARSGIPAWVVPVLAVMPIWAFAYLGALNPPSSAAPVLTPIQQGAQ